MKSNLKKLSFLVLIMATLSGCATFDRAFFREVQTENAEGEPTTAIETQPWVGSGIEVFKVVASILGGQAGTAGGIGVSGILYMLLNRRKKELNETLHEKLESDLKTTRAEKVSKVLVRNIDDLLKGWDATTLKSFQINEGVHDEVQRLRGK